MARGQLPGTFTVIVFTRHSPDFPRKDDRYWRRCNCRKYLYIYIYEDGRDRTVSAKTRSWERAERLAQEERAKHDPDTLALRKSARNQVPKETPEEADAITVEEAPRLWVVGFKLQSLSTAKTYRTVVRKISNWAAGQSITLLQDVTPAQLDRWRAEWSLEASRMDDRMGPTTQSQFLTHLKSFFRWAYEVEHIGRNPAKALKSIATNPEQTMPLTPEQFNQVMAAVELYDRDRRREQDRFGTELKALCLVMRWTGLRLTDALMLPRTALSGNCLSLTAQKTNEATLPVLPDHVVAALKAIQPRPGVHPRYFFWSRVSNHLTLGSQWAARIKRLNRHLALTKDHGKPMEFRSHMLRDTFAVEMQLASVPIETVSKMLTHTSVRVTERHYAPWVKSRRQQLRAQTIEALRKMGAEVSL